MYKDFEDYLMEKHAEQFIGTKDVLVDDFYDWLQALDVDLLIDYGNRFSNNQSEELLKIIKLGYVEIKVFWNGLGINKQKKWIGTDFYSTMKKMELIINPTKFKPLVCPSGNTLWLEL